MSKSKYAANVGKAGEYAVASQLLLRNISVFFPAVDEGCDLMTSNGCRIQVKSAHLYKRKDNTCYFFPLPKTRRMPKSDSRNELVIRVPFASKCDYVIFWGIEQNRFWIVPAAICDDCTGVELGGILVQKPDFHGSISDMREMKNLGYSNCKIAKHYGLTATSIRQFLDSGRDFVDESSASQMRSCEGRWDFITDFVRTAVAVNAPAKVEED